MSKAVYCVLGTHKAFTSKQEAYAYAAQVDLRRGWDMDGDRAVINSAEVFGFDTTDDATEVWVGACWSDRDRTEHYFVAPEGRGDCYIIQ